MSVLNIYGVRKGGAGTRNRYKMQDLANGATVFLGRCMWLMGESQMRLSPYQEDSKPQCGARCPPDRTIMTSSSSKPWFRAQSFLTRNKDVF